MPDWCSLAYVSPSLIPGVITERGGDHAGDLDGRTVVIAHTPCGENTNVSKDNIKSDLARLDRMTDEDIDYSDIPELDDKFFTQPPVQ